MDALKSLLVAMLLCTLAVLAILLSERGGWLGVLVVAYLFCCLGLFAMMVTGSIIIGVVVQLLVTWFLVYVLSNLVMLLFGPAVPPEPTEPVPDDWKPPTTEEIARVLRREESPGEPSEPPAK